jgi:hypothetical protein
MLKSYKANRFDHWEEIALMLMILMIPLMTMQSIVS